MIHKRILGKNVKINNLSTALRQCLVYLALCYTSPSVAELVNQPPFRDWRTFEPRGQYEFDQVDGTGLPPVIQTGPMVGYMCGYRCDTHPWFVTERPATNSIDYVPVYPVELPSGVMVIRSEKPFRAGAPQPLAGCTITWGTYLSNTFNAYSGALARGVTGPGVYSESGSVRKPHGCAAYSPLSVNDGIYNMNGASGYIYVEDEIYGGWTSAVKVQVYPRNFQRALVMGFVSACEGPSSDAFASNCTVYYVRGGVSTVTREPSTPAICTTSAPMQIEFGTVSSSDTQGMSVSEQLTVACNKSTSVSINIMENPISAGPMTFSFKINNEDGKNFNFTTEGSKPLEVTLNTTMDSPGGVTPGIYNAPLIIVVSTD